MNNSKKLESPKYNLDDIANLLSGIKLGIEEGKIPFSEKNKKIILEIIIKSDERYIKLKKKYKKKNERKILKKVIKETFLKDKESFYNFFINDIKEYKSFQNIPYLETILKNYDNKTLKKDKDVIIKLIKSIYPKKDIYKTKEEKELDMKIQKEINRFIEMIDNIL